MGQWLNVGMEREGWRNEPMEERTGGLVPSRLWILYLFQSSKGRWFNCILEMEELCINGCQAIYSLDAKHPCG